MELKVQNSKREQNKMKITAHREDFNDRKSREKISESIDRIRSSKYDSKQRNQDENINIGNLVHPKAPVQ